MCGIISMFSNESKYSHLLSKLLAQMIKTDSIRGEDSTGLMIDVGIDQPPDTIKKVMNGYDFCELKKVQNVLRNYHHSRFIVGHNRAATAGRVNSSNAHPFTHGSITGVHNGTISNKLQIAKPLFDVDSEAIIWALNEYGSEEVIPKINGAFNLIWYDTDTDCIHQVRNSERPYSFVSLKQHDVLLGASESKMLEWLLHKNSLDIDQVWHTKEGVEYIFDLNTLKVRTIKHELLPKTTYNNYNNNNNNTVFNNTVTTSQKFHFFITEYEAPAAGKSCGIYKGYSLEGDEVFFYEPISRPDIKFKINSSWYEGEASVFYKDEERYLLKSMYIKEVADEDVAAIKDSKKNDEDELSEQGKYVCASCNTTFDEDLILFSDSTPICQECFLHYDQADYEDNDLTNRY